jgi:hypothetical protein
MFTEADVIHAIHLLLQPSAYPDVVDDTPIGQRPPQPTPPNAELLPSLSSSALPPLSSPAKAQPVVYPQLPLGLANQSTNVAPALGPIPTQSNTEMNAEILATKWMTPQELKRMVAKDGLIIKKGRFSATESFSVNDAIEEYQRASSFALASGSC